METGEVQVRAALELYVEFLNHWAGVSDGENSYVQTTERYLRYDPEAGYFGSWSLKAMVPCYSGDVYIFSVSDGDDGGPVDLLVTWQGNSVAHIVQGFDTMWQSIYDANDSDVGGVR